MGVREKVAKECENKTKEREGEENLNYIGCMPNLHTTFV
jgi:hypothetical protein